MLEIEEILYGDSGLGDGVRTAIATARLRVTGSR
jgi:hypothetical protein